VVGRRCRAAQRMGGAAAPPYLPPFSSFVAAHRAWRPAKRGVTTKRARPSGSRRGEGAVESRAQGPEQALGGIGLGKDVVDTQGAQFRHLLRVGRAAG